MRKFSFQKKSKDSNISGHQWPKPDHLALKDRHVWQNYIMRAQINCMRKYTYWKIFFPTSGADHLDLSQKFCDSWQKMFGNVPKNALYKHKRPFWWREVFEIGFFTFSLTFRTLRLKLRTYGKKNSIGVHFLSPGAQFEDFLPTKFNNCQSLQNSVNKASPTLTKIWKQYQYYILKG